MKLGRFMKKKGALVAIGGIVVAAGIGVTWAVTHDLSVINNDLALANYQTTFTENFTSPPNWQTCQTVSKTITATNNSNVPIAVRVKLEGTWTAADGVTNLPNVSSASGLTMAVINYANSSDWTQEGGYYVYNTDLAPNTTTTSVLSGVTLNCEANLDESADGAYAGATYNLKATFQTIQADKREEWKSGVLIDRVMAYANEPYEIDFTRGAVVSDDPYTSNGNGVNRWTENGTVVYYYRGQIEDNNVIWADKCWKIFRTTKTGGVKLVYNGTPTVADGVKQCIASGTDTVITDDNGNRVFKFNSYDTISPADVGYMYGTRIERQWLYPRENVFIFSNNVSRVDDTYYLDVAEGQSISGTWSSQRRNAAQRYHYFCTDGASSCDSTKIGYILYYGDTAVRDIWYLPVGGYDDIEEMKDVMFANDHDSNIKTIIESWFESEGLDALEGELEDTVFCNDRRLYNGALKGKDSDATKNNVFNSDTSSWYTRFRITAKNERDNFDPSLDCGREDDAFTVDSSNGNGKLKHKIGLITADETVLAGLGYSFTAQQNYIYGNGRVVESFTMSPSIIGNSCPQYYRFGSYLLNACANEASTTLRPVVSLKAGTRYTSGSGLSTDPYIVP